MLSLQIVKMQVANCPGPPPDDWGPGKWFGWCFDFLRDNGLPTEEPPDGLTDMDPPTEGMLAALLQLGTDYCLANKAMVSTTPCLVVSALALLP